MEGSHGSSRERNSNGKHHHPTSGGEGTDSRALEAELRAKLERTQAARERTARECEAWGSPPAWFQEEK